MSNEYIPIPPKLLWWAVNEDGDAFFYSVKPQAVGDPREKDGHWVCLGFSVFDYDYKYSVDKINVDWKNSLKYLGDSLDATE